MITRFTSSPITVKKIGCSPVPTCSDSITITYRNKNCIFAIHVESQTRNLVDIFSKNWMKNVLCNRLQRYIASWYNFTIVTDKKVIEINDQCFVTIISGTKGVIFNLENHQRILALLLTCYHLTATYVIILKEIVHPLVTTIGTKTLR